MSTRAENTKVRNDHENEANTEESFRAKNQFPVRTNEASIRGQGQLQGDIKSTDFNMLGMQTRQLPVRRAFERRAVRMVLSYLVHVPSSSIERRRQM